MHGEPILNIKMTLAGLLLLLAQPAFAGNEPDGVHGVPWGATQETLKAKVQGAGDTVRCDSPELCRVGRARFGSVPVDITYLFPNDGTFEMAIVRFKAADYKKLLAVFVDLYGDPASARRERTRLGECAPTENLIFEWTGPRVVMDLRHFETRSEGRATIMLKALRESAGEAAEDGSQAKESPQGNP